MQDVRGPSRYPISDQEEYYLQMLYGREAVRKQINDQIRECTHCSNTGLNSSANCTESAPGYGSVVSPVFIIGQSLCDACRETQVPFTRGSGDLLDIAILRSGYSKIDLFTTNVVHCHPPGNRASKAEEVENCSTYLKMEFDLVKPRVVILLGASAFKESSKILKLRVASTGKIRTTKKEWGKVSTMRVCHPAYFLYSGMDKSKVEAWISRVKSAIKFGFSKRRKENDN